MAHGPPDGHVTLLSAPLLLPSLLALLCSQCPPPCTSSPGGTSHCLLSADSTSSRHLPTPSAPSGPCSITSTSLGLLLATAFQTTALDPPQTLPFPFSELLSSVKFLPPLKCQFREGKDFFLTISFILNPQWETSAWNLGRTR